MTQYSVVEDLSLLHASLIKCFLRIGIMTRWQDDKMTVWTLSYQRWKPLIINMVFWFSYPDSSLFPAVLWFYWIDREEWDSPPGSSCTALDQKSCPSRQRSGCRPKSPEKNSKMFLYLFHRMTGLGKTGNHSLHRGNISSVCTTCKVMSVVRY